MKRLARILFPLLGLALLAAVLAQADIATVHAGLVTVGWAGVAIVLCVHACSFLGDSVLWQLSYERVRLSAAWCARFYGVRLLGEAYNNLTPFASMGGEPVKARLLRDRYGIDYGDSGLAFLVAKTGNLVALAVFLAIGFAAMLHEPRFDSAMRLLAAAGLAAFAFAVVVVVMFQRARWLSRIVAAWGTAPATRRRRAWHDRIAGFDNRLAGFYRQRGRRFVVIVALAFGTWLAGVIEVWIIGRALGHPLTFMQAWMVEAIAQLVRTAAFFIPAGLGVVDAGIAVTVGLLTGAPDDGVVVALVRRFRDLIWIALGILLAFPLVHTIAPADLRR